MFSEKEKVIKREEVKTATKKTVQDALRKPLS
jgi:hypothetical protein